MFQCPTEGSQGKHLPPEVIAHESRFHFFFPFPWIDGEMEGGMKRWSEWAIVLLLQTGHSARYPRDRGFFKVASYSASYLCVYMCVCVRLCVHAWVHAILWVSITFSQADISHHAEKKKCKPWTPVCLCERVLTRASARGSHKSPRSDGRSTAVGYERSLCLFSQAREPGADMREEWTAWQCYKCSVYNGGFLEGKCHSANALRYLNNTSTCNQTIVGIQAT